MHNRNCDINTPKIVVLGIQISCGGRVIFFGLMLDEAIEIESALR